VSSGWGDFTYFSVASFKVILPTSAVQGQIAHKSLGPSVPLLQLLEPSGLLQSHPPYSRFYRQ